MNPDDELRRLWQSNRPIPEESMTSTVSIAELRRKGSKLDRTVRFRNLREHAAAVVVLVAFGFRAATARSTLELLGSVELVLAAAWIGVTFVLYGRSPPAPGSTAATREVLGWRRAQLARQVALLERVPVWYLAPLALGLGALYVDELLRRGATAFGLAYGVGVVVLFAVVAWANRRAAARLRAELAELAELGPDLDRQT